MADAGGPKRATPRQRQRHHQCGPERTVAVGHGHDTFVFNQTTADAVGAVTITGFNPSHDVIDITSALATVLGLAGTQTQMDGELAALFHDSAMGAQLNVAANDTITLTDVHASAYTRLTSISHESL